MKLSARRGSRLFPVWLLVSTVLALVAGQRERAELMQPGRVYALTIHLYPTSNLFRKGHRIRLDISSSNFPRFDVNPNTGEALNANQRLSVATNTVYHDREHPSHVILPIIPPSGR